MEGLRGMLQGLSDAQLEYALQYAAYLLDARGEQEEEEGEEERLDEAQLSSIREFMDIAGASFEQSCAQMRHFAFCVEEALAAFFDGEVAVGGGQAQGQAQQKRRRTLAPPALNLCHLGEPLVLRVLSHLSCAEACRLARVSRAFSRAARLSHTRRFRASLPQRLPVAHQAPLSLLASEDAGLLACCCASEEEPASLVSLSRLQLNSMLPELPRTVLAWQCLPASQTLTSKAYLLACHPHLPGVSLCSINPAHNVRLLTDQGVVSSLATWKEQGKWLVACGIASSVRVFQLNVRSCEALSLYDTPLSAPAWVLSHHEGVLACATCVSLTLMRGAELFARFELDSEPLGLTQAAGGACAVLCRSGLLLVVKGCEVLSRRSVRPELPLLSMRLDAHHLYLVAQTGIFHLDILSHSEMSLSSPRSLSAATFSSSGKLFVLEHGDLVELE